MKKWTDKTDTIRDEMQTHIASLLWGGFNACDKAKEILDYFDCVTQRVSVQDFCSRIQKLGWDAQGNPADFVEKIAAERDAAYAILQGLNIDVRAVENSVAVKQGISMGCSSYIGCGCSGSFISSVPTRSTSSCSEGCDCDSEEGCAKESKPAKGGICRHCGGEDEYAEPGNDGKVCCWQCVDKE